MEIFKDKTTGEFTIFDEYGGSVSVKNLYKDEDGIYVATRIKNEKTQYAAFGNNDRVGYDDEYWYDRIYTLDKESIYKYALSNRNNKDKFSRSYFGLIHRDPNESNKCKYYRITRDILFNDSDIICIERYADEARGLVSAYELVYRNTFNPVYDDFELMNIYTNYLIGEDYYVANSKGKYYLLNKDADIVIDGVAMIYTIEREESQDYNFLLVEKFENHKKMANLFDKTKEDMICDNWFNYIEPFVKEYNFTYAYIDATDNTYKTNRMLIRKNGTQIFNEPFDGITLQQGNFVCYCSFSKEFKGDTIHEDIYVTKDEKFFNKEKKEIPLDKDGYPIIWYYKDNNANESHQYRIPLFDEYISI